VEFINQDRHRNNAGIYSITNKVNEKVYIGKTIDRFIERYWHHVWLLDNCQHHNKYLQQSWNKYGVDNFVFEVTHVLQPDEDVNKLEVEFISKYNSYISGYNLTLGGDGGNGRKTSEHAKKIIGEKNKIHGLGRKASSETRIRMSRSSSHHSPTPEHREILRKYRTGRTASIETRKKIRDANIGSKSKFAVINESVAYVIKVGLMSGETMKDIASSLNITIGIVSAIAQNRSWTDVYVDGWNEYYEIRRVKNQKNVLYNNPVPSPN